MSTVKGNIRMSLEKPKLSNLIIKYQGTFIFQKTKGLDCVLSLDRAMQKKTPIDRCGLLVYKSVFTLSASDQLQFLHAKLNCVS